MELSDFYSYKFSQPIIFPSSILCSECKEFSPFQEWREGEVWCEDCGEHSALICPKCEHHYDHVWAKEFEVKYE